MVLVLLVPIGALAALAGAYPSSALPILAGAGVAFLVSGARIAARETRCLDTALVGVAAAVVLQLAPLPLAPIDLISPHLTALREALYLDPPLGRPTLTADPLATRAGLATLAAALLVFWSAREIFAGDTVRTAARAVAWTGFVVVLVAFIQRATAPTLLFWTWTPADAAQPFSPFLNRNHLATWLLMGASLTGGYLVAHTRAVGATRTSLRLRVSAWLADGTGLLLAGALLAMLLGLVGTLSRAAILGAVGGLALALACAGAGDGRRTIRVAGTIVAVLLVAAVWFNREGLARKFGSAASAGRVTIWRETIPVVRDFWVTGTGLGTYGQAMLHYQRASRHIHFNQAHNEYLQVAAEGGLLLVAPLLTALVVGLRQARVRLQHAAAGVCWIRVGAAAGLAGVAVQGLFETGLRVPANALLAALLAAIVLHDRQER